MGKQMTTHLLKWSKKVRLVAWLLGPAVAVLTLLLFALLIPVFFPFL